MRGGPGGGGRGGWGAREEAAGKAGKSPGRKFQRDSCRGIPPMEDALCGAPEFRAFRSAPDSAPQGVRYEIPEMDRGEPAAAAAFRQGGGKGPVRGNVGYVGQTLASLGGRAKSLDSEGAVRAKLRGEELLFHEKVFNVLYVQCNHLVPHK